MTTHPTTDTVQETRRHTEKWRCVCGAFLVAYDPTLPCYLERRCTKCKRENVLDRREMRAA